MTEITDKQNINELEETIIKLKNKISELQDKISCEFRFYGSEGYNERCARIMHKRCFKCECDLCIFHIDIDIHIVDIIV